MVPRSWGSVGRVAHLPPVWAPDHSALGPLDYPTAEDCPSAGVGARPVGFAGGLEKKPLDHDLPRPEDCGDGSIS